jgi:glycerophosphoryl diester phosphodiesterase
VQEAADGEAMVFHDFTLDRLTGETGRVTKRSSADLARIRIAGSAEDRIPTLAAFLERIAGRVPLVVEIKSAFDGSIALTRRTCEILAGYRGPVCIKSFDPVVVASVRAIAPQILRGIVAESHHDDRSYAHLSSEQKHALGNLLHLEASQPQFLSWRVTDLPTGVPYLARVLGKLPVMAWTVRTPAERERAAAHADQMVFEGFMP